MIHFSRPHLSGDGIERSWVVRPAQVQRYSTALSRAWADGIYLTAWPWVALTLPWLASIIGVFFGATHWTPQVFGVIGEQGVVMGPFPTGASVTVFAQSIPFLMIVAFVGALSARAGLLLALGYAVGDYLIVGPQFGMPPPPAGGPIGLFGLSNPYITAFCYVRLPQLILYALLLLLAVLPTLVTRTLVDSLVDWGTTVRERLGVQDIVRAGAAWSAAHLNRRVQAILPCVGPARGARVCHPGISRVYLGQRRPDGLSHSLAVGGAAAPYPGKRLRRGRR